MSTQAPASPMSLDRTDALEARVAQLSADLEDLAAVLMPSGYADRQAGSDPEAEEAPPPAFGSVDDWVDQYFLVVFSRSTGSTLRWCSRWHDHAEAVLRLEALWRSWETLRLDPNVGMATWLTNFLDPQLAALMTAQGTFASCTPDRHGHT